MKALRFNVLLILLMAPVAYSQATFNVQSSGRGLENAKMGARMQQLHDNQQAVLDVLEPQSFANLPDCDAAGEKINWNAGTSTFTCIQEDDPTVSSFAKDPLPNCGGTEFLQGDGTDMTCVDATAVVTGSEIDPTVEDFAKDTLPTCGANEALKGNGTVLSCVAISGAGVESDPTVYSFAQNPLPTCGVGQVLKANGTVLSCVADTSGGFTESDPLTMTFAKGVMPVCAADEVLSNTDGLGQAFACVDAATAAAGAADDLGSHVATQALDMAGFAIDDVLDPVQAQDAATKNYVDTEVAAGVASVSETDPTVRDFAKDALPNCTATQVLSGDGSDITCVDAATAAAGAADNLGNHVATQALNMSGYNIGDAARIGVGPNFAGSGFIVSHSGGVGLTGSTIREGSPEFYVNEAGDTYLGVNGSGLINMGSNRVQAVADPTSNQDAATKKYVDDQIASGGADDLGDHTATTSLDMASNTIVNVATPVNTEDAANKAYVDSAVASGGADDLGNHTATQALDMDSNNIINGGTIAATGITATGLNMSSNTIVNVATPVNTEDAANKAYVDSAVASGGADDLGDHTATQALDMDSNNIINGGTISATGITATGLDMSSNTIVNVATPVNTEDAANKAYVDSAVASGGADDLGDHTATQNIQTSGNWISSDGDDEGIYIDAAGRVFLEGGGSAGYWTAATVRNGATVVAEGTGPALGFGLGGSQTLGTLGFMFEDSHNDDTTFVVENNLADVRTRALTILATGYTGVGGIETPSSTLHVAGDIQIGNDSAACAATTAGAIRYNAGDVEFCNGTAWASVGGSGADDLGDHTATQNVELGSNWLSADGTNSGISYNTSSTMNVELHDATRAYMYLRNPEDGDFQIRYQNATNATLSSVNFNQHGSIFVASDKLIDISADHRISLIPGAGYNVGIDTKDPSSTLHVAGDIQIGNDAATCDGDRAGAIRYSGGDVEFCNGTAWASIAAGGADDLGNHTATQALDMDSNNIINGGTIAATSITANSLNMSSNTIVNVATPVNTEDAANKAYVDAAIASGGGAGAINDLSDAIYDGSSMFLGNGAGANDDGTSNQNVGVGFSALNSNTSGIQNVANGYQALYDNTTGMRNVAIGTSALFNNVGGDNNTAIGSFTLYNNSSGNDNVAIGPSVLSANTTGGYNTAAGSGALSNNLTGSHNVASGFHSMILNTEGLGNVASGYRALAFNTLGSHNVASGYQALARNTTGAKNVAVGYQSGQSISDGIAPNQTSLNSVYLGADSKAFADGGDNEIVIGYNAVGLGSNTAVLGNDSIVTTALKGDVGIGTDSPSSTLHVAGDIQIGNDSAACAATTAGAIRYNAGDVEFCNGTAWASIAAGGADDLGDHTATQNIALGTNWLSGDGSDEGLLVKSHGGIVVGDDNGKDQYATTNEAMIQIIGASRPAYGTFSYTRNNEMAINYYCKLSSDPTTLCDQSGVGISVSPHPADGRETVVEQRASAHAFFDRQGLTEPLVVFDRRHATENDTMFMFRSPDVSAIDYTLFDVSNASGPVIHADNNANVGIGTVDASSTLHVAGDIQIGNDSAACAATTAGAMRYNGGAIEFCNGTVWASLGGGGGDDLGDHTATQNITLGSNYLSGDGGDEGIAISSTGGVTISATHPLLPALTVHSDTQDARLRLSTASALEYQMLQFSSPAGLWNLSSLADSAGHGFDISYNSASIIHAETGGNVGIGTNSPSSTLHVAGDIQIGNDSATCAATTAGAIRYNSPNVEFCNGTAWAAFAAGGGASAINGLSDAIYDGSSVFLGNGSGVSDDGANANVAVGKNAMASITSGQNNTAIGENAMNGNASGNGNTAIGRSALLSGSGAGNVAIGVSSLQGNNIGWNNVSVGSYSMENNNNGQQNVAIGTAAMWGNQNGIQNVAMGDGALNVNQNGNRNTALGFSAGKGNTSVGDDNVFIGHEAGLNVTGGARNTLIGSGAGDSITGGNDNILIGYDVDLPTVTTSNYMNIANAIYGNLSSGNVGMGTDSPSSTLHVSGTIIIADGGEACAAGTAGGMRYNGGVVEFCNGTAWASLGGGGADDLGDHTATTDLDMASNNITNVASLNIESVSSTYALHVSGSDVLFALEDNNFLLRGARSSAGIRIQDTDNSNNKVVQIRTAAGGHGLINLYDELGEETVEISGGSKSFINGGRFGIGTDSPSSTLHVAGDIQIGNSSATCAGTTEGAIRYNSPNVEFCNGTAWASLGGGGADNLGDHTATQNIVLGSNYLSGDGGDEGIAISSTGGVTISATHPLLPALTVHSETQDARLRLSTASALEYQMLQFSSPAGLWNLRSLADSAGHGFDIAYNNASIIHAETGGNVGIGTNAPSETLHLSDAAATIAINAESGPGKILFQEAGSDRWSIVQDTVNGLSFDWGGTSAMFFEGTGNSREIGIGTDSPSSTLHVVGDIQIGNSSATCAGTTEGAIRYNTAGNEVEFCDGTAWASLGGGGGGDDLGDHTATATIQLGSNRISNDGGANEGISFDPNGRGDIAFYADPSDGTVGLNLNDLTKSNGSHSSLTFSHSWVEAGEVSSIYDGFYSGQHNSHLRVGNTSDNSIWLDANGNVGIGTEAPEVGFHVSYDGTGVPVLADKYGAAASVRLRGARGTKAAPTAILAGNNFGNFSALGYGTTGFHANASTSIKSVAVENFTDATQAADLTFSTSGSGELSTTERMRITSTGMVGIGTTSPSSTLHVMGAGTFSGDVTATAFNNSSDRRLKDDIRTVMNPLEIIRKLRGVFYKWKDSGKDSAGVIAQEVQEVMPHAVVERPNGMLAVEYNQLVAPMIEAIKMQQDQIEALQSEVETLKEQVNAK